LRDPDPLSVWVEQFFERLKLAGVKRCECFLYELPAFWHAAGMIPDDKTTRKRIVHVRVL